MLRRTCLSQGLREARGVWFCRVRVGSEMSRLPLEEQRASNNESAKRKRRLCRLIPRYLTSAKKPAQLLNMEQVRHTWPAQIYCPECRRNENVHEDLHTYIHTLHKVHARSLMWSWLPFLGLCYTAAHPNDMLPYRSRRAARSKWEHIIRHRSGERWYNIGLNQIR